MHPRSVFWHSVMLLALAAGVYARFKGIGRWPLAADEYYTARSIQNILDHGLPTFACSGAAYARGILYQYLVAPLMVAGLSAEFSLRVVAVLSNLLAIPAVYQLGKKVSGVPVACAAVAFFSLSLWEIEFARFGRMYAPFQALFVWYLLFLYRGVVEDDKGSRYYQYALSLVGLLLWQGAIFLLLLNFVPLLLSSNPRPFRVVLKDVALTSLIFLLGYTYLRGIPLLWFFPGDQAPLPADVTAPAAGGLPLRVPYMLWQTLPLQPMWLLASILPAVVSVWAVYACYRQRDLSVAAKCGVAVAILASLLNLFAIAFVSLLLLLVIRWLPPVSVRNALYRILLLSISLNFLFWLTYGITTDAWYQHFFPHDAGLPLKKLFVLFIKYPDIFETILFRWFAAVPVTTVVLGGLLTAAVIWLSTSRQNSTGLRFLLFVLILLGLAVGFIVTDYVTTRYTFFLFPLALLVALATLFKISSQIPLRAATRDVVFGVMLVGIIAVSDDVGFAHMLRIDSAEINYRLSYDENRGAHYYSRFDSRTPAEFVNKHKRPGDVIVTSVPTIGYYLERLDYVYRHHKHGEFRTVSCNAGQRERWTNARLIYREDALYSLFDQTDHDVWLILSRKDRKWAPDEEAIAARYADRLAYTTPDEVFEVYRISN